MLDRRFRRGWSADELARALHGLERAKPNFADAQHELTAERRWNHVWSQDVVARESRGPPVKGGPFERAKAAIASWSFSDPRIVTAWFDPRGPLLGRVMLLELRVLGFRFLSPVRVGAVRNDSDARHTVYGFRIDTLEGHAERGSEWFLVTKDHAAGELTFRIQAAWRPGELPEWWTKVGFALFMRRYQRAWHRLAHLRLRELLADRSLPIAESAWGLVRGGPDIANPAIGVFTGALGRSERAAGVAPEERETRAHRHEWPVLAGLGALAGLRSMLTPALVSTSLARRRQLPSGPIERLFAKRRTALALGAAAAGESLFDKLPSAPRRTVWTSLVGRALSGAAVAALMAERHGRSRIPAAMIGAASAVAGAFGAYRIRKWLGERTGIRDPVLGVGEDGLVLAAGSALVAFD